MSRSFVLAAVLLASATQVEAQQPAGGPGHAAALLPDQTIVVIGGMGSDGVPTGAAMAYAPLDAASAPTGTLAFPRAHHSATSLYDGRIVVIGGNDGAGAIGAIEIYDPLVDGFRPSAATLAAPRQDHEAVALADGRVLVRGGRDGAVPVTADEVYDPRTDTIAPAPAGLRTATVTTDRPDYLPGDTVYVSGAGFAPGETVMLLIDEEPLQHVPRLFASIANDRGEVWDFTTLLVEPRDLGASFVLHAVGASSGVTADARFTDGASLQVAVTSVVPSPLSLLAGESGTITYRVSTKKDEPFSNIVVTVVLPPGLEADPQTPTPSPFNLPGSATQTFQYRVRAVAAASGNIVVSVQGEPGTPAVQCSGKNDPCSDSKSVSFTVSAPSDTTPPVLTLPGSITAEATSSAGATATFSVSAVDAVSGSVPVACSPSSGSAFPPGASSVSCSATDAAGNTATGSFRVTVVDTIAPAFGPLAGLTAEATGPAGAAVTFGAVTATDAVAGHVTATCTPPSGSTFPIATTTVACTARDPAGNSGTASFTVTVRDTTPPVFGALPAPIVEATGPGGAVVDYGAVKATDLVDGEITASCSPVSGTLFALGATEVVCTATDRATNPATASFTVTVRDTTPPVFGALPAPVEEATGPGGAVVTYGAITATDLVSGAVAATCAPASGTTFPLGRTTVSCTAADAAGNAASESFDVTVRDTTPPAVAKPPDVRAEATAANGATVLYDAVHATDVVSGTMEASCTPASGSTFAPGLTEVTCSATDDAGNTGTASFTVWVQFSWSGLLQPIGRENNSAFKAGSTIPVKFTLQGGSAGVTGLPVAIAVYAGGTEPTGSALEELTETVADTGTLFRNEDGQYIYNLSTKGYVGGDYWILVNMGDGVGRLTKISLRR